MPAQCSGCGRPPASRNAQRCSYCGGALVQVPGAAPASALRSPGAAATEVDLPFPDVTPVDLGAPPEGTGGGYGAGRDLAAAAARVEHEEAPRTAWPPPPPESAGEGDPGGGPTARPARKPKGLSPEARAILEAREPPLPIQILLAPFATRARTITVTVIAIILLAILGLNAVIESSRPEETARGPAIEVRPGGGIVPVLPDPGPGDRVAPSGGPEAARRAAEAALGRIGDALHRYGDRYKGLPDRLSPDLRELSEFGDLSVELVHFAPGSLGWKHHTRINVDNDSGVLTASSKRGDALELKVDWEKKAAFGNPNDRR